MLLNLIALAGCGTRLTPTVAYFGGRAVEVVDTGTSNATDVLESGFGNDWSSWERVASDLAGPAPFHRLTLSKDRVSGAQKRIPSTKSSNRVLSPRLFGKKSPSTNTSMGFLVVEAGLRCLRRHKRQAKMPRKGVKTGDLLTGFEPSFRVQHLRSGRSRFPQELMKCTSYGAFAMLAK